MRGLILFLAALSATGHAAKQFKIMSFCDPIVAWPTDYKEVSGVLSRFEEAGFNTLSGDVCQDEITAKNSSFSDSDFISIRYNDTLTRIVGRYNARSQSSLGRFLNVIKYSIPYNNISLHTQFRMDAALSRFGASYTGPKSVIQGYNIGDEPTYTTVNLAALDSIKLRIALKSPGSPIFLSLFPSYSLGGLGLSGTGETLPAHHLGPLYSKWSSAYLPDMLRNGVSFVTDDHYMPSTQGELAQGAKVLRRNLFKDYWVMATTAKSIGKPFFPVLLSVGAADNVDAYNVPTPSQLDLSATVALAYGAKSIEWYTYRVLSSGYESAVESPTSPVRPVVTRINKDLGVIGDTLYKLNWLTTLHGSALDPNSGEEISPVVDRKIVLSGAQENLILGVFTSPAGDYFLLVGNKSLNLGQTFQLKLPGDVAISELQKSNASYTALAVTKTTTNNVTYSTFTVPTIQAGGYRVIRIKGSKGLMLDQVQPLTLRRG